MKITKKSITLLLAGLLCASNSFSQTYPKQDGVIRLLTYNTTAKAAQIQEASMI